MGWCGPVLLPFVEGSVKVVPGNWLCIRIKHSCVCCVGVMVFLE